MNTTSPFIINDPAVPPIFAGRKKEITTIQNMLFNDNQSMAIYGHDAIGKSSILQTIHQNIKGQHRVFSISINAMVLRHAIEGDFLGLITQQICIDIWVGLIKRKFSDLVADTLMYIRGEGDLVTHAHEDALKQIYKIVTNSKFEGTGKQTSDFGGKFVLSAKISNEKSMSYSRAPLTSFEFLHLVDELNDILKDFEYDSLLIVCDEMNHIPANINADILREHLMAFSSKKIKFLLTLANPEVWQKSQFEILMQAFSAPMAIGHFEDQVAVQELISNVLATVNNQTIGFSKAAYKTLFEITEGHPWWVQKIGNDAYFEALANRKDSVSSKNIEKNSIKYTSEIQVYKEKMLAGVPFRKGQLTGGW